mgnify:CR=1 FL=1
MLTNSTALWKGGLISCTHFLKRAFYSGWFSFLLHPQLTPFTHSLWFLSCLPWRFPPLHKHSRKIGCPASALAVTFCFAAVIRRFSWRCRCSYMMQFGRKNGIFLFLPWVLCCTLLHFPCCKSVYSADWFRFRFYWAGVLNNGKLGYRLPTSSMTMQANCSKNWPSETASCKRHRMMRYAWQHCKNATALPEKFMTM